MTRPEPLDDDDPRTDDVLRFPLSKINAAELWVTLDKGDGVETPDWVLRIANSKPA